MNTFPDRGDRMGFGGFRKYQKCAAWLPTIALEERTGFRCDVALIIVTTEETTQGIFIDGDQLDLYESRFVKRAQMFHEIDKESDEIESSSEQELRNMEPQLVARDWKNVYVDLAWLLKGWTPWLVCHPFS